MSNTQTAANSKKIGPAKTASITLRGGNGAVLTLNAVRKENGTALTTVTTRESGEAKSSRGMSQVHRNFEVARTHIEAQAQAAIKLGWKRGTFAVAARPDAFSSLPAAPKVS